MNDSPESKSTASGSASAVAGEQSAIEALRALIAGGAIIEEFRPLCQSLDWQLGQEYWHNHGSQAFLGDKVPFKITNDGNLARKAADLLYANIAAADAGGVLEREIRVLELGVGVGLFARYLLDAFRRKCATEGRDYYDRLKYIVADSAPRMLDDLQARGVLAAHASRCEFRLVDATAPESALGPADGRDPPSRALRAVFLNYLLDCLPAAIVRIRGQVTEQLHVRTRLARHIDLRRHTRLSLDEIKACATSPDPARRREITGLYRLFALDLAYRPLAAADELPYLETAARCPAGETGGAVLHNFGAIGCLERMLGLLAPGGFVLIDDYVDSPFDVSTQSFRYQRFAGSSAVGLNLELLRAHFEQRADCTWIIPPGENRHLASRLLARAPAPATVDVFQQRFSVDAFQAHFVLVEQARSHLKSKRHESALILFTQALECQPENWALLTEIADFLAYTTHDYAAALRTIDEALKFNPWWAEAWNTRGDCLYFLERFDEAHAAFERALSLKPHDGRTLYNLSFMLARRGEPGAALARIAEGLAHDHAGKYRTQLLQKQTEILAEFDQQRREADAAAADRFRSGQSISGTIAPENSVCPLGE